MVDWQPSPQVRRPAIPRRSDRPGDHSVPLAAWTDSTFLHYAGANLLLKAAVVLYRAGLLPSAALARVLLWSEALAVRGRTILRRRSRQRNR